MPPFPSESGIAVMRSFTTTVMSSGVSSDGMTSFSSMSRPVNVATREVLSANAVMWLGSSSAVGAV